MCTTNGCNTTTTTTCACDGTATIIDPIDVTPITATEGACNKYSFKYDVHKNLTGNTETNTVAGQFLLDDGDILTQAYEKIIEVISEIIRAVAVDTYVDPTGFVEGTDLATVEAFRDFFLQGTYVTTNIVGAKIAFITNALYTYVLRLRDHINTTNEQILVCGSEETRLQVTCVRTCLFDLESRYN